MSDFDPNIQEGFGKVNIAKSKLLEELETNKEKHIKEYEKATRLYKETKIRYLNTMKEAIDARLKDTNEDSDVSTTFDLRIVVSEPVSHAKQYENAIKMLGLSTATSVILGQAEFNKYVLDDWEWKQSWDASNYVLCSGVSMVGELTNNAYIANYSN